jgi:subtilisin
VGAFINGQHDPQGGGDVDSHGSHVCGIIGAKPAAPGQFSGIAPGCGLLCARVFPDADSGADQGDIVLAIDELSRNRQADLINMSLGAKQASQIEHDGIIDALERGTLCVCAAGNSAGPPEWPGRFPESVAVSAVGLEGWGPPGTLASTRLPEDPAEFGNDHFYLANFSCFGDEIACTAPGVGILSTVPERFGLAAPYAAMDGTSMASPAACGALAVLLAGSSDYKQLPRDRTRAEMARRLLAGACRDLGLAARFQGRGMPGLYFGPPLLL